MFGLLNEAEQRDSLNPEHYAKRRGRFYLIWNASKTCGRPMLVALMAGNSAHEAETTDTYSLMTEINSRLKSVFPEKNIPAPTEVIVTRWKRDPFTRGTYSYVGPETRPDDYDLMSNSVGNLHFAGEATCGTHPATVHGAFLSGLRVAAEVMDAMAGPISLPMPLVGPALIKQEMPIRYPMPATASAMAAPHIKPPTTQSGLVTSANAVNESIPFIKQEQEPISLASIPPIATTPVVKKPAGPPRQSVCSGDPSFWAQAIDGYTDLDYEAGVVAITLSQIGERPVKPSRPGVNPFLLFTKDKWEASKAHCVENNTIARGDAIRATIGRWWKALGDEAKQPYLAQSQVAQEQADSLKKEYEASSAQWDTDARRIRQEYMREHPPPFALAGVDASGLSGSVFGGVGVSRRKTNVSNCIVLDHL